MRVLISIPTTFGQKRAMWSNKYSPYLAMVRSASSAALNVTWKPRSLSDLKNVEWLSRIP